MAISTEQCNIFFPSKICEIFRLAVCRIKGFKTVRFLPLIDLVLYIQCFNEVFE